MTPVLAWRCSASRTGNNAGAANLQCEFVADTPEGYPRLHPALLLDLLLATVDLTPAQNLVANPSFELGMDAREGWTFNYRNTEGENCAKRAARRLRGAP